MRKAVLALVLAGLVACLALLPFVPLVPAQLLADAAAYPWMDTDEPEDAPALELRFSRPAGFYAEDFTVEITAGYPDAAGLPEAAITYTTDGSDPAAGGTPYTGPVLVKAGAETACVVLRAVAVHGGQASRVCTQTYFVGRDVDTRFSTLVFSLTTDPANLYDHQRGIFVDGRIREEHMAALAEEGYEGEAEWYFPSNLNQEGREAERPVNVQVFTRDGACVVAQDAGLRVQGGGSRKFPQKSLRLIAREEYEDGAGKFRYAFFPGHVDAATASPITRYDSLVLRNGSNDRYDAMVRNEAALRMAANAGYAAASPCRAAAVFLNGEYYGFAWLQESLNQQALEDIYAAPEDAFVVEDLAEANILPDGTPLREQRPAIDFSDDAAFARYQQLVDVDDILFYYAFETYIASLDWPRNNARIWRYTGEGGAHPHLDGRWRYLLYDLDWIAGLYREAYDFPTLHDLMGDAGIDRDSVVLQGLLARPELAQQFANLMCDMASCHLSGAKAKATVAALWDEAAAEVDYALENGAEPGWNTAKKLREEQAYFTGFFARRQDYIYAALREYFGYGEMFRIEAEGPARISTNTAGAGDYFAGCAVPLTATPGEHEAFSHWEVNGRTVEDETLTVTADDAVDGVVRVKCITQKAPPPLVIESAGYGEEMNSCRIANTTGQRLELAGWHLTDDINQPERWAFPDIALAPGGTMELVGARRRSAGVLLKVGLSFNIGPGETLALYDPAGNLVDWYYVPDAEAGETPAQSTD